MSNSPDLPSSPTSLKRKQPSESSPAKDSANSCDAALKTAFFGQPVSAQGHHGVEIKLEGFLSRTDTFQQWLSRNMSKTDTEAASSAVQTLRLVLSEIEVTHQIHHFHFKIQNAFDHQQKRPLPGCTLTVITGDSHAGGPHEASSCMSCDLTCPLSVGVGADTAANAVQMTSSDSLLSESQFTRVWIDAKARPMLIFTPVRHVERLSDMSNDELHDFLVCVQTALTQRSLSRFHCAIVNHGDFRNHAHLHLKLRFQQHAFEEASKRWPTDERTKVERIRAFAASVEKNLPQRGLARVRQDE